MRNSFFASIFVIFTLLAVGASHGQPLPPQLTVSGSGEIKVAPNEVYLRAGVETRHQDLMQAKMQNDAVMSKALAFLKQSVAGKDIQTDFVSFQPVYEDPANRLKPTVYIARNSIEVRLTNINNVDLILSGLMTNGVNVIHGIDFRTSELRKHRDAARALALQAAVEKADAIADELKIKRGKVYSVSASDNWWGGSQAYWGGGYGSGFNRSQNSVQYSGNSAQDSEGTFSAGVISVSASVNVSFLVE